MRIVAVAIATAAAFDPMDALFAKFKQDYQKVYKNAEEETARKVVFAKNVAFIQSANAKNSGMTLEINEFADVSREEFSSTRFGLKMPERPQHLSLGTVKYSGAELPTEVDWTTKGAVTEVKNQGQCGSCWSFSTTGALEGANFLANGKLVSLSEQEFVDCDHVDQGCNGGLMDNAFQFAEANDICTEESYSYQGVGGSCQKDSCTVGLKKGAVTGFHDVDATEEALMEAVSKQPVAIAIEADQQSFQFYKSGVMTASCGTNLDHGVLLVGYGEESGQKYWKVKNSWGPSWGASGYIKLARGISQQGGQCGLLLKASYPEIAKTETEAPANGHYEKPPCASDEAEAQLTGSSGVLCAPKCDASGSCPTDFPSGVTASPMCALKDQSGNQYCALMCTSDDQCDKAGGSSCSMVAGSQGVCTYPATLDAGAMDLAFAVSGPTGKYCGDVAEGLAKVQLSVDDATHVDVDVQVFGQKVQCQKEEVAVDSTGKITMPGLSKSGDCAHDEFSKFGVDPTTVTFAYDSGSDAVNVNAAGQSFSLTKAKCSSNIVVV